MTGERRRRALPIKRHTKGDRQIARLLYPDGHARPATRGDCEEDRRPCPYVGCRHHLGLDVTSIGSILIPADCEPWEIPNTCSLDLAARGGMTLDEIGALFEFSRERARQIEEEALAKLRRNPDACALLEDIGAEPGIATDDGARYRLRVVR